MTGPLSGTIDIPHIGKLPKVAVLGGVGVVLFLVIRHYQNSSSSTAAAGTTAAAGADPYPSDGTTGNPNDPYSLDPTTGVTYGDEAASGTGTGYGGYNVGDAGYAGIGAGTAAGGGYGISAVTDAYPWDGTYSNPNDPYSMNPSTGQTYGDSGTTGTSAGVTTGTGGPPFSTNAQWSQYVLQYFSSENFSDLAGMQSAVGAYIAGQAVTSLQQGYINDAIAVAGPPPVAGPGNYPPSIKTTGSVSSVTGPTSNGNTPSSTVPVVGNGHIVSLSNNRAVVAWSSPGATSWAVTRTGPGGTVTNNVSIPQATYGGLEAGHNYELSIQPLVNGKPVGSPGKLDFKTTG